MKASALFVSIFGQLLLSSCSFAQFNYSSFDVKCDVSASPSACPSGLAPGAMARSTAFNGINSGGDIVGAYADSLGKGHGFLLTGFVQSGGTAGQVMNIDVPGSLVGALCTSPDARSCTLPTTANGINPAGDVVGNFTAPVNTSVSSDNPAYCPALGSAACIKGFLYRRGRYSIVLFPGHPGAVPQRISPDGDIYGCLHDFDLGMSMFGAVWSRLGNASLQQNGGETTDGMPMPMSMNNGAAPAGNVIVGLFNDMTASGNPRRGYTIRDGVFQPYDAAPSSTLTAIWDVNPEQQFVGTYIASTGIRHGFLQNPDRPTSINIDPPGAAGTIAMGINPDGWIVGQYTATGNAHGFVAVPATD